MHSGTAQSADKPAEQNFRCEFPTAYPYGQKHAQTGNDCGDVFVVHISNPFFYGVADTKADAKYNRQGKFI